MGKKKNVDMAIDPSVATPAKVTKKKSMTIWEDLYLDLAPRVAAALRSARVKPDQLRLMADGEIMATEGIGEVGLEDIRAKYASEAIIEDLSENLSNSETPQVEETSTVRRARHPNRGGKKIKAMKSKVEAGKPYPLEEAVKLVKSTNLTSFDATITLHLNLREKLSRVEINFPHLAGVAKRIAIADDDLITKIEKGIIEFDILLTTSQFMPKLAKYAKVLGPKGLMPSPKSGTVTPDPEAKQKEFEGGKTVVKGESQFPLMHIVVGKVSQKEEELLANLEQAILAVKPKNIEKAVLSSTRSPGVKLQLT